MSDLPIYVVEPQADRREEVLGLVPSALPVADVSALADAASGAAIVILGPTYAAADRLGEVGAQLAARPAMGALLISDQLTTEVLQASLRAGVRDVLTEPTSSSLQEAIDRVVATMPVGATSAPAAAPAAPVDTNRGRLVTVFSTKGGAGKTVLATNLAVSLARQQNGPVVLVDADLQFGDVAVMLKLAPQHTIVDAVTNYERLDPSFLQNLLIRHEQSGLYVLAAPLEPAFAEQIGAKEVTGIVNQLLQWAAYVVIDTPAYFNEVVLSLIEESDDLVLLAGMDIPNIKNVKIGIQTLRLLNTPMEKIRLVLNRSNSKVKLDVGEVERSLQSKAECHIPSDVVVPQSVNKGIPVVIDAARSGPAKAIEGLARSILSDHTRR